jgi:tRNA(Ile)-lysidine synthase
VRVKNPAKKSARRIAEALRALPWFRPGLRIGIGVSGGADSVALLTSLVELRAELGIVVSAIHYNHKLRGKASDADEKFVAVLAEKFGVTLHVGRGDVAERAKREKANLEDAARRARYGFFARLADQGVVDLVATAHTMDDQAETVLAHIFRGTGIAGLAGIHPVSGSVARPLLGFRRETLRKYLRAKNQRWREDASNRDTTKTRARMRARLLPLLEKQFNPAVVEHLAALAERAREQTGLVEHWAEQFFRKHVVSDAHGSRIGTADLLDPLRTGHSEAPSKVLRAKLIQEIVKRTRQRRGQISAGHVAAVVKLAKIGEPGKRLQLPGGVDVLREKDALVFRARRDS